MHIIIYFFNSELQPDLYGGVFPVYDHFSEVMKPVDVFNAIINTSCTSDVVCTCKPVGVKDAATFLVDTTRLKHPNDLKFDDMGGWFHKGKPIRYFEIQRVPQTGDIYGAKQCPARRDEDAYKLTRIYYHHMGTTEFRKTIFYVHGKYF